MIQYRATHSQYSVILQCDTIQCELEIEYSVIEHSVTQYSVIEHSVTQYSMKKIIQYESVTQYSVIQYSVIEHSVTQYSMKKYRMKV